MARLNVDAARHTGRITCSFVAAPGPELDLSEDEVAGLADAGRPAGDPVLPNHDDFIDTRGEARAVMTYLAQPDVGKE